MIALLPLEEIQILITETCLKIFGLKSIFKILVGFAEISIQVFCYRFFASKTYNSGGFMHCIELCKFLTIISMCYMQN